MEKERPSLIFDSSESELEHVEEDVSTEELAGAGTVWRDGSQHQMERPSPSIGDDELEQEALFPGWPIPFSLTIETCKTTMLVSGA